MKTLILKAGCSHCADAQHGVQRFDKVVTLPRFTGLGDVVAYIIHALTGITPCPGCTRRRSRLNKWFPLSRATPTQQKLMNRILDETPHGAQFPFVLDSETGRITPYVADQAL